MTRHRLQHPGIAGGPLPLDAGPAAVVVVMCEGHRLAAVVPFDHAAPRRERRRTRMEGRPDPGDVRSGGASRVVTEYRANVPGDAVEPLTRPGIGVEWRLDGVTVRTWTVPAGGSVRNEPEPVEVPARPFACRRHRGGHYLDGAALRQVTDDAQRRGRQIVVNVSRVSRIDR